MTKLYIVATVAALLALNARDGNCRTWRVEKDGSGDFSVIQDAVDASASGDTIHVGPGRYNEGQIATCPGWSEFVRVLVTKSELTFIGSGSTSIIGQDTPWELSQGWHKGIVAMTYWGNNAVHVRDLTFENVSEAVYTENSAAVEIVNSTFRHNRESVSVAFGGNLWIRNCRFEYQPRDARHVFSYSNEYSEIADCDFILDDHNIWIQEHLQVMSVSQSLIVNCRFLGGDSGVGAYVGPATIDRCYFQNQTSQAVTVELGSTMSLTNCNFLGVNRLTRSGSYYNHIVARGCVFDQVGECTIRIGYTGSVDIQECDLGRGVLGVVYLDDYCEKTPMLIDMRNNYWGTDSADSIQAWIRDSHDSAQTCGTVLYEPFEGSSTPTESTTWGALKSLFR